jgi:hypothetical protein
MRFSMISGLFISLCLLAPAGPIAEDGYSQAVQRGIRLREAPLLDFPIRKSIHVRTYGAIAGDNKTDTLAIQKAYPIGHGHGPVNHFYRGINT